MRELNGEKLYVWWLDQPAYEAVARDHKGALQRFPFYLRSEFMSREGVPGRLRLWTAPHMPHNLQVAPMGDPDAEWPAHINLDMGGLVVEAPNLALLKGLPGIVTDLWLRVVDR
jgi:hypothetical protein